LEGDNGSDLLLLQPMLLGSLAVWLHDFNQEYAAAPWR